jgi:beta-glucosidase-like glycosyl hydrolase/CubicO group peptidase (beta-lactamase class C family)
MKFFRIAFLTFAILPQAGFAYPAKTHGYFSQPDTMRRERWVDSVYQSLTLRERIAQLFMVAAYSNRDQKHVDETTNLVKVERVGGLIFFQGGPVRQVMLTNRYQSMARVPLLISMDAEWGLGMRLDSTVSYPRQMMMAAASDQSLVYQMAADLARQLKRLGVHINFAPVVDINSNPLNPVINTRSFGEDRETITQHGLAYMRGLQENGIIACAKHFPGHGDTYLDSHYALPTVLHDGKRLDSLELYPFKRLIKEGVNGVMVGHLRIPSLEPDTSLASSISPSIVQKLLIDSLKFAGLIFTDAMNMKGVADRFDPVKLNILALRAGNDIILCPDKVKESISKLEELVARGEFPEAEINRRCRKVLVSKYYAGLSKRKPIEVLNLMEDLNRPSSDALKRKIIGNAITILNNKGVIPVKNLDTLRIAYVEIGYDKGNAFREQMELYAPVTTYSINPTSPANEFDSLMNYLDPYNLIIVGYHATDTRYNRNYGVTPEAANFLFDLSFRKSVILDIFGNPYTSNRLLNLPALAGFIVSFDNSPVTQSLSAQIIFGGLAMRGKLPVSINGHYPIGSGLVGGEQIRLRYAIPEEIGIDSKLLNRVDSIALDAIAKQVAPGMQILAARDGVVFYHKCFGSFTYNNQNPVDPRVLYDVASLTKVTATLPMVMSLTENGSISVEASLGDYLNLRKYPDKAKLKLKDILTHQSGLAPWIPFYLSTLTTLIPGKPLTSETFSPEYPFVFNEKTYLHRHSVPSPELYQSVSSDRFPNQVANNLYSSQAIGDTIFKRINNSKLRDAGKYRYSDLGFLYLQRVVETISGQSLNELSQGLLYKRMGMNYTTYLPLQQFDRDRIVPTENDLAFRKQLVWGYVHDPAAAMLGGVAGHAGIFSTANDLAKLMQMYLQKGEYGGVRYFKPETVELFTSRPSGNNGNRRGLGFDKPETQPNAASPVCPLASPQSFGHSGFTGTMVWADPANGLVYVFLSNRVYPDASNSKLVEMNIRTRIQEIFYKAVAK